MTKTTSQKPIYVLDACALICFIYKEKQSVSVANILQLGHDNKVELIMSNVNFGEVMLVAYRKGTAEEAQYLSNIIRTQFNIEFYAPDLDDSQIAGFYKSKGGIAYMDGFVLALAKKKNAKILTLDKEFLKYQGEFEVEMLWEK